MCALLYKGRSAPPFHRCERSAAASNGNAPDERKVLIMTLFVGLFAFMAGVLAGVMLATAASDDDWGDDV